MYNVRDYGARGDGVTLDHKSIQKAIDDCAKNGGGTVCIPPGDYVCGTMHFKSHVHIIIEKGATIYGSKDVSDFDPKEENPSNALYQDVSHSYFHHSLFHADEVCDIALTGYGTIDMQSIWEIYPVADEMWCRACKIVAFKNCKDVAIKELTMRNATDLAVYVAGCENVIITGLNLYVHIDGISPDSCKNVVISDCIINAGDDAIVPKTSYTLGKYKYMENLAISNCVVTSRCNGIKFGTETHTGYRNVSITGCVIHNTYLSGIAIESVDGAHVEGFSISNITMRNVGNPLLIMVLNRANGPEGTTIGEIKNVSINNLTITGPYEKWDAPSQNYWTFIQESDTITPKTYPFIIIGQENSTIKNLSLSNIQFTAEGGGTEEDRKAIIPDLRDGYPECDVIGPVSPVYGMIARYVDNLKLYNVEFFTEKEDARDAIYLDKVTGYKNV
ncbi:MAG: right-handed parallel beta-helix repeat-containing protein [Clostridia bacterium]|nr:right-handed parallel beta-helix repeat-containing protein [Clostridia bacterium]